jgi:prefoldin subunit 5
MSVFGSLKARVRGDDIQALRDEIAVVRETVASINHRMGEIERVVSELNHDVRSGSEEGLPLFLGYAERFRTDADTMIGVTELIDRQLAMITRQVERLTEAADRVSPADAATDAR